MEEINSAIEILASEIERLGIKVLCHGINFFNCPTIHVAPKYTQEITQLITFFNVKTINPIQWGIQPKHDLMIVPMIHGKINFDLIMESVKDFGEKLKKLKVIPEF